MSTTTTIASTAGVPTTIALSSGGNALVRVKPTQPPSGSSFPLHTLDQILPIYVSLNLFFKPISPAAVTLDHFSDSLAHALDRYPVVAGSVCESEHDGGSVKEFVLNGAGVDLLWEEWLGTTFADLPGGDSTALSPRGMLGNGDPEQTLLMIKITKLACGTVCVALSASHMLCDCTSYTAFIEEWARQSCLEPSGSGPLPTIVGNRHPDEFFPTLPPGTEPIPPHGLFQPTSPLSPPPPPPPSAQTTLLFSAGSLRTLKAAAKPAEEGAWISTGDALSALLWRAISRARVERIDREEVHMGMAVDGRSRSKDPKAETYFGNLVTPVTHTLPKSALLSGPLASVALSIRRALDTQLTPEKVGNMLAFLARVRCVPMVADPGRGDTRLTNWTKYDLLGKAYTFGGGLGQPWRVTAGAEPSPPGQILVVNHEEGYRVSVCTEPEYAERLRNDEELVRYAVIE